MSRYTAPVAVYVSVMRYSDVTIDQQLQDVQKYLIKHNIVPVEIYKEPGSGYSKPVLGKLLSDSKEGKIKTVIVWSLEGLSTHVPKMHEYVALFGKYGVKVETCDEGKLEDTRSFTSSFTMAQFFELDYGKSLF